MADIFEKCAKFDTVKKLVAGGIYAYFKPLQSPQGPVVKIDGKEFIMLGSNNYLGLADDPRMKEAAIKAISEFGTGSAGSRFLNGNTIYHEELEKKLAGFKGKEAGLIYSAGYQMNVGVVSCLLGEGDFAIVDKLDHASILDGVTFSGATMKRYRHNDMEDLERILSKLPESAGKLIIVDGVFSMEGDICNLPEIVRIAKKYKTRIMVDDAHGSGVIGKKGRGTCEHFGMENDEVDLVVGTCSKSFASVGGFVVGKKEVMHYVRHKSRSMVFSAALPVGCVAAISKALDIIDEEPERRTRLFALAKKLKDGFNAMGFDTGETKTPIIPVIIGDDIKCFGMWRMLYEAGIFTTPVITPAVPPDHALIRVSAMATHEDKHIDRVLETFASCAKKLSAV